MDQKTKFIEKFTEQLEGYSGPSITSDTLFRNLAVWDSLTGVAVQIMIADDFNAKIPDDSFVKAKTVEELYQLMLNFKE